MILLGFFFIAIFVFPLQLPVYSSLLAILTLPTSLEVRPMMSLPLPNSLLDPEVPLLEIWIQNSKTSRKVEAQAHLQLRRQAKTSQRVNKCRKNQRHLAEERQRKASYKTEWTVSTFIKIILSKQNTNVKRMTYWPMSHFTIQRWRCYLEKTKRIFLAVLSDIFGVKNKSLYSIEKSVRILSEYFS